MKLLLLLLLCSCARPNVEQWEILGSDSKGHEIINGYGKYYYYKGNKEVFVKIDSLNWHDFIFIDQYGKTCNIWY